jgi:hypothetical protein
MRHERYVIPYGPAGALPELPRLRVLATNEEVTLDDPKCAEPLQHPVREPAAETLAPVSWGDGQVLEITPATVGTPQDGPDNSTAISCDEAEPRVAG